MADAQPGADFNFIPPPARPRIGAAQVQNAPQTEGPDNFGQAPPSVLAGAVNQPGTDGPEMVIFTQEKQAGMKDTLKKTAWESF